MYLDETAALCDLLLPQHHALERWDDLRPRAGVYSLMQPVMEPVFNTCRPAMCCSGRPRSWADRWQSSPLPPTRPISSPAGKSWRKERREGDFAAFWHGAVQRGGLFVRHPPCRR